MSGMTRGADLETVSNAFIHLNDINAIGGVKTAFVVAQMMIGDAFMVRRERARSHVEFDCLMNRSRFIARTSFGIETGESSHLQRSSSYSKSVSRAPGIA